MCHVKRAVGIRQTGIRTLLTKKIEPNNLLPLVDRKLYIIGDRRVEWEREKTRERKKKGERAREAKAGLLFQREFEREGDGEREREEQSM